MSRQKVLGAPDPLLAVPICGAGLFHDLDAREFIHDAVEAVQARRGEEATGDALDDGHLALDCSPLLIGDGLVELLPPG